MMVLRLRRTFLAVSLTAGLVSVPLAAQAAGSPTGANASASGATDLSGVLLDDTSGGQLSGAKAQSVATEEKAIAAEDAATASSVMPATVSYTSLSITLQMQQKSEWCVPTSSRATLSAFLSAPPSQTSLAKAEGTSDTRGTYVSLIPPVLNAYQSKNVYTWYKGTQSAKDLFGLLRANVKSYRSPIIPAMQAGDLPLWEEYGYTGNHVALYGYGSDNSSIQYADPIDQSAMYGKHSTNVSHIYQGTKDLGTQGGIVL
jgi:hypothetical protein